MMKSILSILGVIILGTSVANAGVFDINYHVKKKQVNTKFGVAFKTGYNGLGGSKADRKEILAGDFYHLPAEIEFGFSDRIQGIAKFDDSFRDTSASEANSNYSTPELGFNFWLMKSQKFNIDAITTYSIALTKEQTTPKKRIGHNSFQGGLRAYGALNNFQYGVKLIGQYVFANPKDFGNFNEDGNFVNMDLLLEGMFYMNSKAAIKLEFDYKLLYIFEKANQYAKDLSIGYVYNFSKDTSLQPYVGYRFKSITATDGGSGEIPDNQWKLGIKASAQF